MKKVLMALGVVLVALLASLAAPQADASPTMHNCPQDGQWSIAVWAGDETDAGEALGTCGNIEVAYALTPTGAWLRYIADAPEINTLETLNQYDGVIALGGPMVPVAEPETNVSLFGTLPDDCRADLLTVSERSAGDGSRTSRVSRLHDGPFTAIEQTDEGQLLTRTYQQMAVIKEFTLLCNDEVLLYADVPKASGSDHIYTIQVLVNGSEYEVLPRQHEYIYYDCGKRADGTTFICRLSTGSQRLPFNPTCPTGKWHRPADETLDIYCPGYPGAVFGAFRCDDPEPGEEYCIYHDRN